MNIKVDFLSEEQSVKFFELIEQGYSTHELGREFGITQTRIMRWLHKNNIKTNPRNSGANRKKIRYCKICNSIVNRENKYCNNCIKLNLHLGVITDIENAKDVKVIKRILINTRGAICEKCKISSWFDVPISLELHHIDGNSDNNSELNLQLLCPNCHSITKNYRVKNKGALGKRNSNRRKYYKYQK